MEPYLVWIFAVLSLTGAALVAEGRSLAGQIIWTVPNTGLAVHNYLAGDLAQAALFLAFLGFALRGICKSLRPIPPPGAGIFSRTAPAPSPPGRGGPRVKTSPAQTSCPVDPGRLIEPGELNEKQIQTMELAGRVVQTCQSLGLKAEAVDRAQKMTKADFKSLKADAVWLKGDLTYLGIFMDNYGYDRIDLRYFRPKPETQPTTDQTRPEPDLTTREG